MTSFFSQADVVPHTSCWLLCCYWRHSGACRHLHSWCKLYKLPFVWCEQGSACPVRHWDTRCKASYGQLTSSSAVQELS